MTVSVKNLKRRSFLLLIFLIFIKKGFCLTPEEIISIAEKKNPELIKIKKELSVIKKKVKVAKRLFNPSVSLSLEGEELFKSPLESGKIYIKQYIPYPKKFEIRKEIEKKKYRSEYFFLLTKKEKIFADIYREIYKIWFLEKAIDVYNRYIKKVSNLAKNLRDEEKLRVENLIYRWEIKKEELFFERKKEIAKLSQLVNQEINTVSVSLSFPFNLPELGDILKRLDKSPFYKSVEYDIEKSKEIFRLSKMIYYPDFTISARVDTGGSLTKALSLGIGVRLPIWRTVRQEQEVLSKQLDIIGEKEKRQFIKNQLEYSIKRSFYNIQLSKKVLKILKNFIPSLKKETLNKKGYILERLKPFEELVENEIKMYRYIFLSNLEKMRIKSILGEL